MLLVSQTCLIIPHSTIQFAFQFLIFFLKNLLSADNVPFFLFGVEVDFILYIYTFISGKYGEAQFICSNVLSTTLDQKTS